MKNILNFRNAFWLTLSVMGIAVLQSCVVYHPDTSQLITVPDVVQMSKDGLSSGDIIDQIKQSHTAYNLKADQLVKLHEEGVQDSVINYMEETKINLARQNERYAASSYWWPYDGYFYGGFGWGGPYYGLYGWGWGPTIIYSVNRGYRGGFHGGGGGFHGGGHGFRR